MHYQINKDAQRSLDDLSEYIELLEKTQANQEDQIKELTKENQDLKNERDQLMTDCDELTNENEALHNLNDPKESTKVILM
jgi:uncharacterized coiled-coil protein SlyX